MLSDGKTCLTKLANDPNALIAISETLKNLSFLPSAVAVLNTLILVLLWKHLWRAFWMKGKGKAEDDSANSAKSKNGGEDKDNVAITIGDCAAAAGCLPEDNFLIEVVLALFDFFRISQTKQD